MDCFEIQELKGCFVKICAIGKVYPQEIHGWLTEYDESCVCIEDAEKEIHIFEHSKVISIEPVDFKSGQ